MTETPSPPPPADPIVTIYLTREGRVYPLSTHESTRWIIPEVFQKGEYALLRVPGWEAGTVVDIGANVGVFTLFAALHLRARRILAYEPVAASHALLAANVRGVPGVEAHRCALLDRDGEARIWYGRHNQGECSLERGLDQRDEGEVVSLRRASSELDRRGIERIGVLKVDTEGSEIPILRDLEGYLPRTDFLLVEYHREEDRLELDRLLAGRFLLFGGRIQRLHTGVLKYVRRDLVAAHSPEQLDPRRPG